VTKLILAGDYQPAVCTNGYPPFPLIVPSALGVGALPINVGLLPPSKGIFTLSVNAYFIRQLHLHHWPPSPVFIASTNSSRILPTLLQG